MALEEDDGDAGIPEWVVTFGDMMSLLLTFFIMLVSLSEIKDEERYQAMVEAVRRQFGYDASQASLAPGKNRPRNTRAASLASAGRARRLDTHRGGDKVKAAIGDHSRVRIIRPGEKVAVGTMVTFEEGQVKLSEPAQRALREGAAEMYGKPQKIEIRGHTSPAPVPARANGSPGPFADHYDLAYQRCRKTMQFLVNELDIEPARIRISTAGASEPIYLGEDPLKLKQNPRVEVFMLEETAAELAGDPAERERRYVD